MKSFIKLVIFILLIFNNYTYAAVSFDSAARSDTGANSSYGFTLNISVGHTNMVLIVHTTKRDTGTIIVSSISGAGGSWAKCAGPFTGNGNVKGEIWWSIPVNTGAQGITVNYTGAASNNLSGVAYSLYGADQTAPCQNATSVTGGNLVITSATNNITLSTDTDNNDMRTVTGCTSSLDVTGFSNQGVSGTHCTGASTTTYTWNTFSGDSIALGN